jgi:hypothetical protein
MTDIEFLTDVLGSRFPSAPTKTDEAWGGNVALCVLDSLLSLYTNDDRAVLPRVKNFAHNRPDVSTVTTMNS